MYDCVSKYVDERRRGIDHLSMLAVLRKHFQYGVCSDTLFLVGATDELFDKISLIN